VSLLDALGLLRDCLRLRGHGRLTRGECVGGILDLPWLLTLTLRACRAGSGSAAAPPAGRAERSVALQGDPPNPPLPY
jgi:hypothetical protein